MENLFEAFDSKLPTERNEGIETMTKAMGYMMGNHFSDVQAHSTPDHKTTFLMLNHEGAREIHILGPNMSPFFTKDHPSPMKVFSTAIGMVKDHADAGKKVRLVSQPEPESVAFYQKFADRASKLGYNVKHKPEHTGSSGMPVVAWEISKEK
jgi:hypothetical protein